jgi:hypothetical protein
LLLGSERLANSCLSIQLCTILLYPAPNRSLSQIQVAANIGYTQALILHHARNLQFEVRVKLPVGLAFNPHKPPP